MAKAIASRFVQPYKPPEAVAKDVPFWAPPKGVNYLARASRIDTSHAWEQRNFEILDGVIRPRRYTNALGLASSVPCEVGTFVTSDGYIHIFRMTNSTIERWNGASWVAPTNAPVLNGGADDHLSYTAWNNTMVWTNGKDGLYEWNWSSDTVTLITAQYIPKSLTTFMSRIFLSNVYESGPAAQLSNRLRWSVKDNSLDYTALGSGYEDFLSTPGGYVDKIQCTVPINDSQALVIRENSTWVISETGDVDAPVRVGRQFAGLGTQAPRSVVEVPGGAIGLFNDSIYVVTESNLQNIGQLVIRRIQERTLDFSRCCAAFDNRLKRYCLVTYDEVELQSVVYIYSMPDDAWTTHVYPYRINSVKYAQSPLVGLTIDTMTGTFDAASGTIDSETSSANSSQLLFGAMEDALNYWVIGEVEPTSTTLIDQSSQASIVTGLIQASSPLEETYLLEVQIEYEADVETLVTLYYTNDLGRSWFQYSTARVPATNGPKVYRFVRVLRGHNLQLKVETPINFQGFKLLAFVPSILVGAKVNP